MKTQTILCQCHAFCCQAMAHIVYSDDNIFHDVLSSIVLIKAKKGWEHNSDVLKENLMLLGHLWYSWFHSVQETLMYPVVIYEIKS